MTDLTSEFERIRREARAKALRGPYDHIDITKLDFRQPEPEQDADPPPPGEPQIREDAWGRHAMLLADTGAGKTNVIRWRIMQLLPLIAAGKASLILIDPIPKGILTQELLRLQAVWNMRDRVVWIEPFDSPASINIFELFDELNHSISQAIQKIERTLGSIAINITNLQATPFRFALRALFALPHDQRTIFTLQNILTNGIDDLLIDPTTLSEATTRHFDRFKISKRSNETVDKLDAFLSEPIFEALFSTKTESFSILDESLAGKLIIIDASRAPPIYGQFWIEEVAHTIGPRYARVKRREWIAPTTIIIDEAQKYIGDNQYFADILDQAREAKLSAFIAAHHFGQIDDNHVAQSLLGNTKVKFIARTYEKVNLLASTMGHTEASMLQNLDTYEFAFHAPGMKSAEVIKLREVDFNKMPQITEAQTNELREMARPQKRATSQMPPRTAPTSVLPMPPTPPADVQGPAPPAPTSSARLPRRASASDL